MSTSDYLALAAIAISILSAVYSRWSLNEARKANEIAVHFDKVKIYEELLSFSDCFRGLFSVPTAERLEQFRKSAVQRAEIYLPNELAERIREIYTYCDEQEIWLQISQREDHDPAYDPTELQVRSKYKAVLQKIDPVIIELKELLKFENA